MRGVLPLLLGYGLLTGCVGETDQSLRDNAPADTGLAAPAQAEAATPAAGVEVTLSDSALAVAPASVAAGTISIQVRNRGTAPHALLLRGGAEQFDSGPVAPGDSVLMSLVMAAGSYELLCPSTEGGSHSDRGERASLRVE